MQLNSLKTSENKHTVFLALVILSAVIIRILWAFYGALEYWGDGYHNIWMIKQSLEFGDYFDYKDRHLVWLPAYRLLLWLEFKLLNPESFNNFFVPFLLQLWYLGIALRYIYTRTTARLDIFIVAIVVLWPLPIIFSGFNMSEGLAISSVTTLFYLIGNKSSFITLMLISFFAAITVLSRHEATVFLGIYSVVLFFMNQKSASYSIVTGVIFGLIALSYWNWILISDPFFWLSSKFNASSSGAAEFIETVGFIPRIAEALLAILLVFPFLPFVINGFKGTFFEKDTAAQSMFLSTILFLGVFLVASLFFFHGADPKYLLFVSFPCSLWTSQAVKKNSHTLQVVAISVVLILIPIYALLFHVRSFNLELERRLGSELDQIIPADLNGKLWCDFPTTLVYADWDPRKAISTDQMQRFERESTNDIYQLLKEKEVKYIIASDYDHSAVLSFFDKMNSKESFTQKDITFTPIKVMDPSIEALPANNNSLFPKLASFAIERNKEIVVWRLDW